MGWGQIMRAGEMRAHPCGAMDLCRRPALPRYRPSMAAHATPVKPYPPRHPKKSVNLSILAKNERTLSENNPQTSDRTYVI